MMVTLKPYFMQKNLFQLFALTGGGVAKTTGASTTKVVEFSRTSKICP